MIRALILFFLFPLYGSATSQPAKPFSQVELLALRLAGQHQDHMERDIAKRGIDFPLDEDYVTALQAAGGSDALMAAVRKAASTSGSARASGSSSAPDTQVLPHLLQAAKLLQNRAWPEAEKEIRAALAIEPDNPLLHIDLSGVLPSSLGEPGWTAAIAEDREALRLDPGLALAHFHIATALRQQGNTTGAIAEAREVMRLDPDDGRAWNALARLLEEAGDLDGALEANQQALAQSPDAAFSHWNLAELLEKKGDLDGALAQAREAVRIVPDRPRGHYVLARILRGKGDKAEAAKEEQIATELEAKNPPRQVHAGDAVMAKGLIYQPKPTYPREAQKAGIEGTVRIAYGSGDRPERQGADRKAAQRPAGPGAGRYESRGQVALPAFPSQRRACGGGNRGGCYLPNVKKVKSLHNSLP